MGENTGRIRRTLELLATLAIGLAVTVALNGT